MTGHAQPATSRPRRLPGWRVRIRAAALALVLATPLAAQTDAAGTWRVTGVGAGDVLNMRMGPGTGYPVIDRLAPDARGLRRVTCVPFAEGPQPDDAPPPDWCLVQSADLTRAGWVAQRFLTGDGPAPGAPVAAPDDAAPDRPADAPYDFVQDSPAAGADGPATATPEQRFMQGYAGQDSIGVIDRIEALLPPSDSALLPYGQIWPLALAVMALETGEGPRDRVRFRIRWAIEPVPNPPKASPLPVSFIQIDRFSVGGALRDDAIAAYGADIVAPPEAFDVGPHVSWRLVTSPIMGIAAQVHAAGRAEIPEAEAARMTCLGSPCLTPDMVLPDAAPWGPEERVPLALEVNYPVMRGVLLTPAAALERLLELDAYVRPELEFLPETPGLPEPFLEAVIEINLGQDTAMTAAMRRDGLMDDSLAAIWRYLAILPMDTGEPVLMRSETWECHRGPQFPPPGRLCP